MHPTVPPATRRLAWALRGIGALLLVGGLAALYIGPLEVSAYYLFVEGGRFHYPGFRFGSFMFANITAQVAAYYLVAAAAIPLGLGSLRLRRWGLALMQTALWLWLVAGLPLMLVGWAMLITTKAFSVPGLITGLILSLIAYLAAPLLLRRFYAHDAVAEIYAAHDPHPSALEAVPLPVRGICALLLLNVLALHVPLLLNGAYPWFGTLLTGKPGFTALDLTIVALLILLWGLWNRWRWAYWGSLAAFALLGVSAFVTFSRLSLHDLLIALALPPAEQSFFAGLPFLGWSLAIPAVLAPAVMLVLLGAAWRHFIPERPA